MTRTLRAAVAPLSAVIAITLAALTWHHLPENTEIYAPFDVRGDTGSPTRGRALTTTVTGLQITPLVKPDRGRSVQAIGVWVLVDATVTATESSGLPRAELLVGRNTYAPSDRLLPGATLGGPLDPDITEQGAWVFDVPPALLDTVGSVMLRTWLGLDPRLDSLLVVDISLTDSRVSRSDAVELPKPVSAAS
ncbi:MAG: hypothetical protein ABWY93_08505 [Mycobacterium sp.]